MYESFFELTRRPFTAAPQPELYYPAKTIETARRVIERCVDRAEGTAMVMGPAGCGKSLLCRWLSERFKSEFDVVLISNGRLTTRRALLQAILFELGLPYRGLEEAELRLALLDHLEQCDGKNTKGILLIVDEAHILPQRLLEEVRMITDFIRGGSPRVRLVLAGASTLEERLATPRLHAFQQRIRARFYLEAMDRNDTIGYIRHQIATCGGKSEAVFTEAALGAVFGATDGIPRLVNQTCDHALVLASAGGVKPIDASGIEEAWADLQQLPTPWSRKPGYADPQRSEAEVIEFGTLDDAGFDDGGFHDAPAAVAPVNAAANAALPVAREVALAEHLEVSSVVLPLDARREADEALDELESHITDLEAEYEPTVDRQPEVELVLGPSRRDPFSETFVQEEVVVDRYAAADRVSPKRTTVYSSEGRSLALLLEAGRRMREKAESVETPAAPEAQPPISQQVAAQPKAAPQPQAAQPTAPAPAPVAVETAPPSRKESVATPVEPNIPLSSIPLTSAPVAPVPTGGRSSILRPGHSREAAAAFNADPVEPEDFMIVPKRPQRDADMIIIEDDPHPGPRHEAEASPVRKQDLRQMFARLRRGSSERI
jgi:type II secretory pathway predicted ATPase ExeA